MPRALAFNEQQPNDKTAAKAAISDILNTPVGQINNVLANRLAETVKSDAQGAAAQIKILLSSPNVQERLLGVILSVEIRGMSAELEEAAINDPSPFVASELADWLYLHGRYDEWETFITDTVAAMDEQKLLSTLLLLNERNGTLDLPAAMASLNLGKALPLFIESIFAKNRMAVRTAETLLVGQHLTESGQLALLQALHNANPPGYYDVLRSVIQMQTTRTPLRWQAIQNVTHSAPDMAFLGFLKDYATQHPDDELLREIGRAQNESAQAQPDILVIQEKIMKVLTAPQSEIQTLSSLPNLIAYAKQSHAIRLNPELLKKSRNLLSSMPSHDCHTIRLIADIDYLLWKP